MEHIRKYGRRTFASFAIYNYRLYMGGQAVSLIGTWIQMVAQTWLVLQLTHSATMIGLLTAAQFLPVLLFGAYGGVITDRFNKRKILFVTQSCALLLALTMGYLVYGHIIQIWMIFGLALMSGLIGVVDNPTRQTFLVELVGTDRLRNAVSLNSIVVNLTRVVGPAIAAILIAKIGLAECFFINGGSFGGVLISLALMRRRELHVSRRSKQMRGQLLAGLRYVRSQPLLMDVLLMMGLVGTLAYEFPVVLPVLANMTFHGDAGSYALLTAGFSIGAVFGGLVIASRKGQNFSSLVMAAFVFGIFIGLMALMPTLYTAAAAAMAVGFSSIGFMSLGNTLLQLNAKASMRGRVMSLWTVAFLGTTPIGGPVIGYISQQYSPRAGLMTGAVACMVAAFYGLARLRRVTRAKSVTM